MEKKTECNHTETKGRESETGSWCVKCGEKVLEVETRPCKNCLNYRKLVDGSVCRKMLMGVTPNMLVTYWVEKGTCFEPSKVELIQRTSIFQIYA